MGPLTLGLSLSDTVTNWLTLYVGPESLGIYLLGFTNNFTILYNILKSIFETVRGSYRLAIHTNHLPKGTHARDFTVRLSHFLASFNNRQGRGPGFQKFC
jgi:hypothetical protein